MNEACNRSSLPATSTPLRNEHTTCMQYTLSGVDIDVSLRAARGDDQERRGAERGARPQAHDREVEARNRAAERRACHGNRRAAH